MLEFAKKEALTDIFHFSPGQNEGSFSHGHFVLAHLPRLEYNL